MTTNRIFITGKTSKKNQHVYCICYFPDVIEKKKQGWPQKKAGELDLEECPAHYTKEEKKQFFAKMRQRIRWAKIGLSDKNEL